MNEVLCDCCRKKVSSRIQAANKAACIYCKSRSTNDSKTRSYKDRYKHIRPKVQFNRHFDSKYSNKNIGLLISV